MCQIGDGTTNIGAFHESLNLAALWKLPIVYVIVNNRLGMGTPVERPPPSRTCTSAAAAYRIPGRAGRRRRRARRARRRPGRAASAARTERQPGLLEAVSYRLRGHSVVDPARYRSARGDRAAAGPGPAARLSGPG